MILFKSRHACKQRENCSQVHHCKAAQSVVIMSREKKNTWEAAEGGSTCQASWLQILRRGAMGRIEVPWPL